MHRIQAYTYKIIVPQKEHHCQLNSVNNSGFWIKMVILLKISKSEQGNRGRMRDRREKCDGFGRSFGEIRGSPCNHTEKMVK